MVSPDNLEQEFEEYVKTSVLSRRPTSKTDFIIGKSTADSYISFVKPEKLFSYNPAKWTHVKNIFEISNSEKVLEIIAVLFNDEDFTKVDNDGASQYFRSNAIKQYYCFLKAREVFMAYSNPAATYTQKLPVVLPLQQIYYGAPGSGKSHAINELTKGESVIRTTFHPDSDYSTFVGAYKPTMGFLPICDELGQEMKIGSTVLHKEQIVYEFVDQAFLQAYVQAWKNYVFQDKKKQFLVIEEINRGNCAQIFGDLFQLLDRNDAGFSDYPIHADKDMQKYLKSAFARTDDHEKQIFLQDPERQRINQMYNGCDDVVSKVFSGEILLLPSNLYIWATMNTSDQSLFPIDSAFKRRWDWQYMPIGKGYDANGEEITWAIEGSTQKFSWWSFLEKINAQIGEATQSEDKKLGFFFCKASDNVISAEKFVGKVIFYLWNDVFKNNGFEGSIFKDADGTELSFGKFYKSDVKGNAIVQKDKVELFLTNLEVEVVGEELSESDAEADVDADESEDGSDRERLTIKFPDGEVVAGNTRFDSYLKAIKKIGLDKAEQVASEKKYHRQGCALISKVEEQGILNAAIYSYVQEQDYYIVKGIDGRTIRNMLNLLSQKLDLQLEVVYE